MNRKLDSLWVSVDQTLGEAVKIIDSGGAQVALVGDGGLLVGLVTDGDVRRALLRGDSFSSEVTVALNKNYHRLYDGATHSDAIRVMKKELVHQVPVIDGTGKLLDLFLIEDLLKPATLTNTAVIMAGGEGKRLRPLTQNCPKPMLRVGGKPILEIILQHCIDAGIGKFLFSVNYLKAHIQSHFGDGSAWGVEIDYLEEEEPLGTGGALSLIRERQNEPLLVMNGDVLTSIDLSALLRFHHDTNSVLTACVRQHLTPIPYGVVNVSGDFITEIQEKPVLSHSINAGIYVLEPELLSLVPKQQFFDLPDLVSLVLGKNQRAAAFPLYEDWLDVGHPETLELARGQWS